MLLAIALVVLIVVVWFFQMGDGTYRFGWFSRTASIATTAFRKDGQQLDGWIKAFRDVADNKRHVAQMREAALAHLKATQQKPGGFVYEPSPVKEKRRKRR